MGGIFGSRKSAKTAPAPLSTIAIVPTTTQTEEVRTFRAPKPPGNGTLPGVVKALPNGWRAPGLDAPLPQGWTSKNRMQTIQVKDAWREHCQKVKLLPPVPVKDLPAFAALQQPPLRLSVSVMPSFDTSHFEFPDGHLINGRFTVRSRIIAATPSYEVVDTEDSSECIFKIEQGLLQGMQGLQVLQGLARSRTLKESGEQKWFVLIKDAFLGPETGAWALIEDRTRGNLRSHIFSGSFRGSFLIRELGKAATAALQALNLLHGLGCVHTDVNLDTVVLSHDGVWKLAGLQHGKQQPADGSGVLPRPAMPGRLRPLEVLLGFSASAQSDIFDLGLVLVEAATSSLLAPGKKPTLAFPEGSELPTLFEELGHLFQLIGPVPLQLAARSPCKESIVLPEGGYLRTLSELAGGGQDDVIEVVQPPPQDPKATLLNLLQSGNFEREEAFRDTVKLTQFRSFIQQLLLLEPQARCSAKEALEHAFLTDKGIDLSTPWTAPPPKAVTIAAAATVKDDKALAAAGVAVRQVSPKLEDAELEAMLKEGEDALDEKGKVGFAGGAFEDCPKA